MNRIVRKHYPVSQLPEDLRVGFENQDFVNVTVDESEMPRERNTETIESIRLKREPSATPSNHEANLGGQFSRFKHLRRANYKSIEEVNEYVRSLRDEWVHRER